MRTYGIARARNLARSVFLGGSFALSPFCGAHAAHAAELERYGEDVKEVAWLDARHPLAAQKLRAGEKLMRGSPAANDLEAAVALFQEGEADASWSGLLPRRRCEALAALGMRAEAIDACARSLKNQGRSALTLRAAIAARVAGPAPASITDIAYALQYALRAHELMDTEPAGHAGRCDIARKLGDTEMLNGCVEDLERVAPADPETARARAFAEASRPSWRGILCWLAVLVAAVSTLAHAVRHGRRAKAVVTALSMLLAMELHGATSKAEPAESASGATAASPEAAPRAGHLSKYAIDDANPESSVPTNAQRDADPLQYGYFIMDLGDRADAALAKGDHASAAKFYRAVAKAVPDAPVGFVKACEQYEILGDYASATQLCAAALTLKGVTVEDYSHYARLALRSRDLGPETLSNLDAVVAHLKSNASTRAVALDIECAVGAHQSDRARLERCVPDLARLAPNNRKTLFYEWALAVVKKDFPAAEGYLAKARTATPPNPGEVKLMERAMFEAMPAWRQGMRAFRDWRIGASACVVLFAGLALLLLRRRGAPAGSQASEAS
jgi:tetratricopeptide (TPR) repeat protein